MVDYLLIHGGAHGPWCWEKVIPWLQSCEQVGQVLAIDLQAAAQATLGKAFEDIGLADYIDAVVHSIEQRQLNNIVIAGHSMAGITIPGVVHRLPERIRQVVYISTSNPPSGQSIADLMQHPLSPLSRQLSFHEMFCNDLDAATTDWLMSQLRADPPRPFSEPVQISTLPDGIAASYVLCSRDQALPPAYQREQAANAGVDDIIHFESGHSAFAAQPQALAELLLGYARPG